MSDNPEALNPVTIILLVLRGYPMEVETLISKVRQEYGTDRSFTIHGLRQGIEQGKIKSKKEFQRDGRNGRIAVKYYVTIE